MATITVQLDDEANAFLTRQIAEGRYPDAAAALQGGVRALQQDERENAEKLEKLHAAIQDGFDSGIAEGDVVARVRQRTGLPPRPARE